MSLTAVIIIVVLVLLGAYAVSLYNGLVRLKHGVLTLKVFFLVVAADTGIADGRRVGVTQSEQIGGGIVSRAAGSLACREQFAGSLPLAQRAD